MRDLILEKYGTLTAFANKMEVSTQRVNYWVNKDKNLSPILYNYIINNI